MSHYKVTLQGIDQEQIKATGEYEAQELGPKPNDEIRHLLETFSPVQCPTPKSDDDDLCPPCLIFEKEETIFTFTFDAGTIFSCETGGQVTIDEAMGMLEDTSVADELRMKTRKEMAPPAALKEEIAPTDTEHVTPSVINTSAQSPQFSLDVWKSNTAKGYTFAPPAIGSFLIFAGLIALKEDRGAAIACLAIGVACFFLRRFVKPWARETLSIGFDWSTNTLWSKRGKKEPTFHPDANRFVDFNLTQKKTSEDVYHDFDGDGIVESSSAKVITWALQGTTSDPESYARTIGTFVSKKEGQQALSQLKQLYASQK